MLTNGKKIWGIWNTEIKSFLTKNGEIEIYDDYDVAMSILAALPPLAHSESHQQYVKIISEGDTKPFPPKMETKLEKPAPTEYN